MSLNAGRRVLSGAEDRAAVGRSDAGRFSGPGARHPPPGLPLSHAQRRGGLCDRGLARADGQPAPRPARPDQRHGCRDAVSAVELGAVHRRAAGRDGRLARPRHSGRTGRRSRACRSMCRTTPPSACGAELVFGTGERPKDFLYFYFGTFIGGGLVLNGQLFLGRTGNAAGVGPMPVPGPDGRMRRLFDSGLPVGSGRGDGGGGRKLRSSVGTARPLAGVGRRAVRAGWISAAEGLASAILSAASPAGTGGGADRRLDAARRPRRDHRAAPMRRCAGWTWPASRPVQVREGTVGAQARSLGAAAIPLSPALSDRPERRRGVRSDPRPELCPLSRCYPQ